MDKAITDYQKWKEQGEQLRAEARQAMEHRFRELLLEAAALAREYQLDFGQVLKPPSPVTAFRYKTGHTASVKKKAAPVTVSAPDPKVAGLQKRLAQTQKKLEVAKAAGKATQNLEDRIYELEDALRLA